MIARIHIPKMTPYQQRILSLLVIATGAFLGCWWLSRVWTVDAAGISIVSEKLPEWDFANIWSSGRLALTGKGNVLFDTGAYREWLDATFGPMRDTSEWSYPPSVLLLGAPFALLPLAWSYLIWTIGGLGSVWAALRTCAIPTAVCLATVISAGAFDNVCLGQTGAIAGALLMGGLLLSDRRPVLAGILFGLLTIKPQLGLVVPICLIASRNWRAIVSASVTAMGLVLVSALFFGWDVWMQFFGKTVPMMRAILEAPYPEGFQRRGITVFLSARALGAHLAVAYGAQLIAAIAVGIATWRLWRRENVDNKMRAAITAVLALLATPYAYSYDMVSYSAATAIFLWRQDWRMTPASMITWLWPELVAVANDQFPISPLIIAFAAVMGFGVLKAATTVSHQLAERGRSPATQ